MTAPRAKKDKPGAVRILLISSNLGSEFRSIVPNGVLALSAYLKRYGYSIRVRHLERPGEWRALKMDLKEFEPDVVGIGATVTETAFIPKMARMAKERKPDRPVVVGGTHATLAAESFLTLPDIDAVCRGEGEEAFLEYLRAWESGRPVDSIDNFWVRRGNDIARNAARRVIDDLDMLPVIDRGAIDCQRILDINGKTLVMVVGRGYCPFDCGFCVNPALRAAAKGQVIRNHGVEYVLEEIEAVRRAYDFKTINIRDDNITWNREWVLEFCAQYRKRFSWPFDCFSRCDTIDTEQMNALAAAGCRHIYLGMESGNEHIRHDVLNKNTRAERMVEVVEELNSLGIKAVVSNMIGLPFETPEMFRDTIEVNKRIHRNQVVFSLSYGAAPKIFIYNPFPGTRLYKLCVEKGWLRGMPDSFRIYRETYIDMPQFPRKEIYRLHSRFRYEVYKDSHPFFAWLFRIYDMRSVRFVTERLPTWWFVRLQLFFSRISSRLRPRGARLEKV